MKSITIIVLIFLSGSMLSAQGSGQNEMIQDLAGKGLDRYYDLYKDLHSNPELAYMEFETAKKMAVELKAIGFEVTEKVGGNGIVGIYKNGDGKVIMLRSDMDGLPVEEKTGLAYASKKRMNNSKGEESPVMHACGHDLHMSVWLATLRTLVALKKDWQGTLVAVGQPAEEVSGGSSAMIMDSLFQRFPRPDLALCYHVSAELPAGTIGYRAGPIFAGVNSASITVFGRGGHGGMPHTTIDPIVLSARIILDLQTIVSREINPVSPAVVTVGAIHGGAINNIIPDDVKMLLTLRFFDEEVFQQIKDAIARMTKGAAEAAGLHESKIPLVEFSNNYTPPVVNDRNLVVQSVKNMQEILGSDRVIEVDPAMVAEDFGKYGRTAEKIPIALFWLGGVSKSKYTDHIENRTVLPPLHNSSFTPDFEPAFRCGVEAMTKTVIDLFGNKRR